MSAVAALFGGGHKTPHIEFPAPPKPDDGAVEEARRKEIEASAKARGRAGTYLTGGSGDTSTPQLKLKRLLGD